MAKIGRKVLVDTVSGEGAYVNISWQLKPVSTGNPIAGRQRIEKWILPVSKRIEDRLDHPANLIGETWLR